MTKSELRAFVHGENASTRRRHEHHRERRRQATLSGLHLPDTLEWILGFPYLHGNLAADVQAYVERLLPRLRRGPASLVTALEAVTVTPSLAQLQTLSWEVRLAASDKHYKQLCLDQHVLRFDGYAAASGCPKAAARVAHGIAAMAFKRGLPDQDKAGLLSAMTGWLLLAAEPVDREYGKRLPARERATDLAALTVRRLVDAYGPPPVVEEVIDSVPNGNRPQRRVIPVQEVPAAAPPPALAGSDNGIVVLREVGAPGTEDGQKIADAWAELVGARLPVATVPSDVEKIMTNLLGQFPHAGPAVDAMRSDLSGQSDLFLRPTIFVGNPGSGKTSFLKAALSALGLPYEVVSCAAAYHHNLVGTDRHWHSAAPSLPMRLVSKHRVASIGIVLDEVEKSIPGSGRGGTGGTFDALLALLEPGTACDYQDKYFQSQCDLSRITWVATANSVAGIPAPLRDRCRVVNFPDPRAEHLPVLARTLLREKVAARGLDTAWALPLNREELGALATAWQGGSLRNLRRLVEAILDARDHCPLEERN